MSEKKEDAFKKFDFGKEIEGEGPRESFFHLGELCGWDAEDREDILWEFIENQHSMDAFIDKALEEAEKDGLVNQHWMVVGKDYTTDAEDNIWAETVEASTENKALGIGETLRALRFGCAPSDQPAYMAFRVPAA